MLSFGKILIVLFGVAITIIGVVSDHRKKDTGELTKAGKFAILLALISFITAAGLQSYQDHQQRLKDAAQRAQELAGTREKQDRILHELQAQRELIEAIRVSNMPLSDTVGVSIELSVMLDSPEAKPYLDRLRKVTAPMRKTSGPNHFIDSLSGYFGEGTLAPQIRIPQEADLARAVMKSTFSVEILSQADETGMVISANGLSPMFRFGSGINGVADLVIDYSTSNAPVVLATAAFVNFADLPGKTIRVKTPLPTILKLESIRLTARSKQSVNALDLKGAFADNYEGVPLVMPPGTSENTRRSNHRSFLEDTTGKAYYEGKLGPIEP